MKALDNVALKIGVKPINFLLLLIGFVVAFMGLNAYYQTQLQYRQNDSQQSHQFQAQLTTNLLQAKVAALQSTLKAVATSTTSLSAYGGGLIEQSELLGHFPGANKVCVAASNITQPQQSDCLSVSFATVNSIRLATEKGMAPIAVMQVGTEQAHLLLAHRLIDGFQQVSGVLLVSYPASYIQELLPNSVASNAYIELQQGTKRITNVTSRGNSAFKQASPFIQQPLEGTYWRLAYWSSSTYTDTTLPWAVLLMIFGSLLVCWLLRDAWAFYLLKLDSKTLCQQINDLKADKMKPEYHLTHRALDDVKDDVRSIAYEKKVAKPSQKEVASVSPEVQEIEEAEPQHVDEALFGSYDIRETNAVALDPASAKLIGAAIGSEAKDQGQQSLVVARDERHVSEQLAQAMIEGIVSSGCDVTDIGAVASPLFYFACEKLGIPSGVMVTTSQSLSPVTTIKCVLNKRALTEDALRGLYTRIEEQKLQVGNGHTQSKVVTDDYMSSLTDNVSVGRPLRIVIDCGNTITSLIAPKLFKTLGCDVIELNCELGAAMSYPANPSEASNLDLLLLKVRENEAELGIAFDSDGDRLAVVDAAGEILNADRLMVLLAQSVLVEDPQATILYDVKSTSLIEEVTSRAGGKAVISPSGYAVVKNKAYGVEAKLAGEYAGHIFFSDRWFGFEDAFYAAARLLEFLANDPLERAPSEVFAALPKRYATEEILVDIGDNDCAQFVVELQTQAEFSGAQLKNIDGLRVEYPDSWGVIRVSNTQQRLSLRFEATNEQALENIKQQFRQQMLQIKPTLGLSF